MNRNFNEIFREITPSEIPCDVFTLVGKIFPVITAGNTNNYNSMIGSGGGLGVLFRKACTWCILRKDRYTLELMQRERSYTMSFFSDDNKEQAMSLGNQSGRDSDKMSKLGLKAIETPDKNICFEEAFLVIECRLMQVTTPLVDDFCSEDMKEYLSEVYKDPNEHRKFVFGEITHVWILE